jgi:signal transduction histidine kinase
VYEFLGEDSTGTKSYPVHLTAVEVFYGETPIAPYGAPGSDYFRIPVSLTLPFDKNHITFTFNRVDKRYPNSVRYRYFLESFDKTWSQPSGNGRVTYSNLPTGQYVFRVMATNQNGSWEAPAVEYKFSVEAPFYRTAAFFAVMGGLLAGSLALFVLVRMRKNVSQAIAREHIRQQEQEVLRKEIARDFHDEMGNQLTRIINYVSLMRLNGEGNGQGQELYRKVEESAKYLYNGTRDFIWAIDPVNDDLAKLFLHIRDFGQKLFEEKDIHFRAFNEIPEKVKLPYGFSREANLIFKEAMTNAFKHAGASNVSFWLRPAAGGYEMVLEDDGVGIDPAKVGSSNGIKNIKARAEKIRGTLVIEKRAEGPGTKVQLVFTINKKNTYDAAIQKTRTHR